MGLDGWGFAAGVGAGLHVIAIVVGTGGPALVPAVAVGIVVAVGALCDEYANLLLRKVIIAIVSMWRKICFRHIGATLYRGTTMDPWEIRADCAEAWQAGKYEQAYDCLIRLNNLQHDDPDYFFYAGVALYAGKYDEGVRLALQGLHSRPFGQDPVEYKIRCFFLAGWCCYKKGDFVSALIYYRDAQALDPHNSFQGWDGLCEATQHSIKDARLVGAQNRIMKFMAGLSNLLKK
jgi:tetratricopeptide (TPR) repeat protein